MGILNDLKSTADAIKSGEVDNRSLQDKDLAFYQKHSKPALERITRYLRDVVKQLDIIQPEIAASFAIPGAGTVSAIQKIKIISIDSLDNLSRVTLPVDNIIAHHEFSVAPGDEASDTRVFLDLQRQQYFEQTVRDDNRRITAVRFSITDFHVPGSMIFTTSMAERKICFKIKDIQGFFEQTKYFDPEEITDDWLDMIGRLIIGEFTPNGPLEISEEARSSIQQDVANKHAQFNQEDKEFIAAELQEAHDNKKLVKARKQFNGFKNTFSHLLTDTVNKIKSR